KVITDPNHRLYDSRVERAPDEALVQSIMARGVIVPLVIYPDGDDVYVEDGRQRRAATIEANRRRREQGIKDPILVPCCWRKGDEATLFEVSLTANLLRSGDRPMERARNMQRLIDFGRTEKEAAVACGVTVQTVRASLALLNCDVKVQRAVESEQVKPTVAINLAKLPREEQRTRLEKMIESGATKGR